MATRNLDLPWTRPLDQALMTRPLDWSKPYWSLGADGLYATLSHINANCSFNMEIVTEGEANGCGTYPTSDRRLDAVVECGRKRILKQIVYVTKLRWSINSLVAVGFTMVFLV